MSCQSPECLFYDPILEGVKSYYRQHAAWSEDAFRVVNKGLQHFQFIVDRDPQRLKCPCRRMSSLFGIDPNRTSDQRCQISRPSDRLARIPPFDYPLSDPTRSLFFAVAIDNVSDLGFRPRFQQVGRRRSSAIGIHPHIERCIETKAEPSRLAIQLQGRNSQIRQYPDGASLSDCRQDLSDIRKISLDRNKPIADMGKPVGCQIEGLLILIDPYHNA